ncbi:MAG: SEC-C domain-containing protein, partial [Planctomycetes bacterium]|nr:SEC-C domain-containing protein [Planctomycetota bacterium]
MITFNPNSKCPCGSGLRYKECCLSEDLEPELEDDLFSSDFDDDQVDSDDDLPNDDLDIKHFLSYKKSDLDKVFLNSTVKELDKKLLEVLDYIQILLSRIDNQAYFLGISYNAPSSRSQSHLSLSSSFHDEGNDAFYDDDSFYEEEYEEDFYDDFNNDHSTLSIDIGTLEISGNQTSDMALYILYCIFHKDPIFFPLDKLSKQSKKNKHTFSQRKAKQLEDYHFIFHQLFDERTVKCDALYFGGDFDIPEDLSAKLISSHGLTTPELKTTQDFHQYHDVFNNKPQKKTDFVPNEHYFVIHSEDDVFIPTRAPEKASIIAGFSDGTCINLFNARDHLYSILLPPELLPIITQPYPSLWSYSPRDRSLELSLDEYAKKVIENTVSYKGPLELFVFAKRSDTLKVLSIEKTATLSTNSLSWDIEEDSDKHHHFTVNPISPSGNEMYYYNNNAFFDLHTGTLYSHQHNDLLSDISRNFFINFNYDDKKTICIKDYEKANALLNHLSDNDVHNIELDYLTDEQVDIEASYVFDSEHPDNLGIYIALNGQVTYHNCPVIIRLLLSSLRSGLSHFFQAEAYQLSPGRRSKFRKGDAKLYKHQGLMFFILSYILPITKDKKGLNKEEQKEFESKLTEFCNHIVLGKNHGKANGFSKQFMSMVKQCVDMLFGPMDYTFFLEDKCYKKDLREFYYPLILSLIQHHTHEHDKNALLVGRSKKVMFDAMLHDFRCADNKHRQAESLSANNIFPSLIPYLSNDINIIIDGEPLAEFNSEELQTKIDLQESEHDINWFDLDPHFFFNGQEISVEEAMKFSEGGVIPFKGKLYKIDSKSIPNLKWLSFLWQKLQNYQQEKQSKKESPIYKLPRSSSLELLALRASGIEISGGEEWKTLCRRFDALEEKIAEPTQHQFPEVPAPLKDHQSAGISWMLELQGLSLGGILADDMGLGKTLQALGFLEILRQQGNLGMVLIVVPTSLVYNWRSEIAKFLAHLPSEIFEAKSKTSLKEKWDKHESDIVICSYGLFVRHIEFFESINWNIALFDEAQNLKNISSKRTSAARKLNATTKFCLTGTPLENHYGEYYSLIDLVVPGALGPYNKFMSTYGPSKTKSQSMLPQDIEFLKLKTAPLVMRREKQTILEDLPDKTENTVMIPFEKQQKKIYQDIAISWNSRVQDAIDDKGESRSQLEMLTALLRLRQVCSCPSSLPNVNYAKVPPKVDILIEQVESLLDKGESVLVFTNFLHTLNYINDLLTHHKHNTLVIYGGVSMNKRKDILEEFDHCEEAQVLLMTLKTGGVGLNLTKANHVFHLEPWWNPAVENQGTDRVHRMGQNKHVHVVRFIMEQSIEEKIQLLKLSKSKA